MPIRHKSIKKVRKDRLKKFIDRRLIKALSHPVREHILAVVNERISSTVQIGDEIELDVTAFHKHVQLLEEIGCIEWVGSRPVRGATEHFYRAKTTAIFDEGAWRDMPASLKADIDLNFVQALVDDVVGAVKGGTFHGRNDKHTSWTPAVFDKLGWVEAMTLLNTTLSRLLVIQKQSGLRILKTSEPGIPATIGILGFETCPDFVRPARTPL
jgi:hypothetical protein